ncbi:MAG: hypothetical protein AAFV49_16730 [Pseudomonadota bacterium]
MRHGWATDHSWSPGLQPPLRFVDISLGDRQYTLQGYKSSIINFLLEEQYRSARFRSARVGASAPAETLKLQICRASTGPRTLGQAVVDNIRELALVPAHAGVAIAQAGIDAGTAIGRRAAAGRSGARSIEELRSRHRYRNAFTRAVHHTVNERIVVNVKQRANTRRGDRFANTWLDTRHDSVLFRKLALIIDEAV